MFNKETKLSSLTNMMGDEPRSSTRHRSRFSFSITHEGSSDAGLEDALQYLSGAMMARDDRHINMSVSSIATTGSRRSTRLSITPFSGDAHHSEEINGIGVSTLLCTCLTANYISVGYLLVPWGKFEKLSRVVSQGAAAVQQ